VVARESPLFCVAGFAVPRLQWGAEHLSVSALSAHPSATKSQTM
jgi:hypothetical protein